MGLDERERWLERVAAIRRHRRGGERAPHKPLLVLLALGQLSSTGSSELTWSAVEDRLGRLLRDYGPPRPTSPAYPFRRLANDQGLWVVETATGEDPGENVGRLRDLQATGRFDPEFEAALRADPGLGVLIARSLLEQNWPPTLHDEIARACGLDLDRAEAGLVAERLAADRERAERRRRDPLFRSRVLTAYEYRCAFCGFDGRLDTVAVGLDAAHIRWWAHDGPDELDNAVCLCTIHHRLLDLGVLGISAEHEVTVSRHFIGHSEAAEHYVLRLVGAPVREPQPGEPAPADDHLGWHAEQVFRAPARVR
ncbi:MAG: HNH endonuclease [Acidimicrobiales bacterium]